MRYRGARICLWAHGSCCLSQPGSLSWRISLVRRYSAQPPPPVTPQTPLTPQKQPISPPSTDPATPPPTDPLPSEEKGRAEVVKERAVAAIQHAGEVGWQWGQRSAQTANASVSYWWERYEEFVGLNEVRVAQNKVNEAEAAFMVARGMVREAHGSLESLQVRLKEVRDRLDRVSREDAHYLELATQEHKLLQEERRLRTAYENAEGSEREKFGLFSAGVRESHEKERSRAERTKNWSIIGSVLGALIGVMGSTYINRVRLQELKTLLLEAQKGPESLQDALRVQAGNHRSQQDELRSLIDSFRLALTDTSTQQQKDKNTLQIKPAMPIPAMPTVPLSALKDLQNGSEKTVSLLEAIPKHMGHLEEGIGRVEDEILSMRKILETKSEVETKASPPVAIATPPQTVVERPEKTDRWEAEVVVRRLEETQRTLGERIRTNNVYNAVFTYTATAITISAVYLLLRGSA